MDESQEMSAVAGACMRSEPQQVPEDIGEGHLSYKDTRTPVECQIFEHPVVLGPKEICAQDVLSGPTTENGELGVTVPSSMEFPRELDDSFTALGSGEIEIPQEIQVMGWCYRLLKGV